MIKYKAINKQPGLFDHFNRAEELSKQPTALDKLNERIDWEYFRSTLEENLDYSESIEGGRPPYDPVLMFKVIILQKYYSLSEEDTEFQIKDRFSFQRFLGLSIADDIPDKNTIWTFKERFGNDGIQSLFDKFDDYLHECGLVANGGKIIDASFVEVPRQRNTRDENKQIKNGQVPKEWEDDPNKLSQKDVDARWTKKNNEKHYGYKNHIKIENESKFIEDFTVTDASVHDSQELANLIDEEKDESMYADSAYSGEPIAEVLAEKGIDNQIHEKGYRSNPLSKKQIKSNTKKSRIRARVEHIFGFQSNNMGAGFIRTIGIVRACRNVGLGNLVYNLFRFKQLNYSMV